MKKDEFKVISNQATDFENLMSKAVNQLGIDLSAQQKNQLLSYLDQLLLWNKAYNLTAIKDPKEALVKHIFDCLAIIPHLSEGQLLDIGTGAGLPGLIVAICQPQRSVTVLDSNQKKIRFIKQVASELKLNNLTPVASRIEHFLPDAPDKFDVITSRAFASLSDFVQASAPLIKQNGSLQAMKGLVPEIADINALQRDWIIVNTPLLVPNLNEHRHLVTLTPKLN